MIDRFRDTPLGRIHTIEWLDAGERAPWLHFLHATGMHAHLYRDMLAPLAAHFRIVASDARGHGRTELAADPAQLTSWRTYQDDLAVLLDSIDAGPWWYAGHSMGATVSAELAARRPAQVAGLVLIEPAFVPFAVATGYTPDGPNPMAEQAIRRRSVWPSAAAMIDAYRGRGVFARIGDDALTAYVEGGVRSGVDGSVELACAPAWEAATFRAVSAGLQPALAGWRRPLALLRGTVGSTVGAADAASITAGVPGSIGGCFEGAGHFLPLERPDVLSDALAALRTEPAEAGSRSHGAR